MTIERYCTIHQDFFSKHITQALNQLPTQTNGVILFLKLKTRCSNDRNTIVIKKQQLSLPEQIEIDLGEPIDDIKKVLRCLKDHDALWRINANEYGMGSVENTVQTTARSPGGIHPQTDEVTRNMVQYLNQQAGSTFRPSAKSTKKLVSARLKEGLTEDDFKTAIDNKVREWKNDEKMVHFLRPRTLFCTKMEDYANQPRKRTPSDDDYYEKNKDEGAF